MYETFYGFKEQPFSLTPDPDFLYLSPCHRKVMSYLTYGMEGGEGFIQVTGEIGSGKTTLVRNLIRSLHPGVKLAYIVNPRGTFRQLLRMILDELGAVAIEEDLPRERLLVAFEQFAHEQADKNFPIVIIFDEAQNLDPVVLEEIRMLSNIEDDKKKLVQIVLVGQPELRELLELPDLQQLNQRIAVKCHLDPLTPEETDKYIRHRLQVAGNANGSIKLSRDASRMVHTYSRGIPRKINIACNAVLLAGFVDEKRAFNARYVREAIKDLDGAADLDESMVAAEESQEKNRETTRVVGLLSRRKKGVLIGALAAGAGLGAWFLFGNGISVVTSAFEVMF